MDAATETRSALATHMLVDASGSTYASGSRAEMIDELNDEHDSNPEWYARVGYAVVPVTARYWIPPYPHHRCPRGWYGPGMVKL